MHQTIGSCRTHRGITLAYATHGEGAPLVKAANWMNHLEFDWESPIWSHWLEDLGRHHRFVRYDERGNGLSDWEVDDMSFDAWVRDLEAVVDDLELERFALLGISQGGPVAVSYAALHPDRVSHLVLYGAYARGWARRPEHPVATERRRALLTLTELGWGQDNPAFRQVWTSQFIPDGTAEQQRWFNELQRITTSPENAVRFLEAFGEIDVTHQLAAVRAPTLVLHCRDDAAVPVAEGRLVADGIPDARFVELPGRNHLILRDEPAWRIFLAEVHRFVGGVLDEETSLELLPRGAFLDYFRIEDRLGEGGMGMVYAARDTRLDRPVAIKVLPASRQAERPAREALLREARTAAGLNHPSICTVHAVGEAAGLSYIAMERVDGPVLADVIPHGGLSRREVARLGRQIAEALAHAHEAGVVHRDLKPGNVMVTKSGRVKVLDFGLARTAEACTSLNESGEVAGTIAYMAPEVIAGDPFDHRSDLWSLGVVLYEMATGRRPFEAGNPVTTSIAILENTPAPIPEAGPSVLGVLVERLLEKDPERRLGSAGEVAEALGRIEGKS